MRGPRFALALLVVASLLIGTQLAFTAVGQEVGPNWSEPTTVASVDSAGDSAITGMAATGNAGVVAWTERHGDEYIIRAARFSAVDGEVSVRDRRDVARSDHELTGVDVAITNGEPVVVWESTATDRVQLARVTGDGIERRTAADMHRLGQPSVAAAGGEPLVVWTGKPDIDSQIAVYAARPGGDPVRVGGPTHGTHAPTVTGGVDGAAVTWLQSANDTVVVTGMTTAGVDTLAVTNSAIVGEARLDGEFGGARRKVPYVASASNESAVRAVWTDNGVASTAPIADRRVGARTAIGGGTQHDIGAAGDRWLIVWTEPGGATGLDVRYQTNAGERGTVSRLPGEERDPTPVYAPSPAVVWYSWGTADEVLISAHEPPARNELRYRLETGAPRFLFIGVVSVLLGIASLPVMPWSLAGLVGAFVVTSEPVASRLDGDGTADDTPRDRLGALPTAVWPVTFATVEIPLTVLALQWMSFGFGHAVGTGLAALVAALIIGYALDIDSGWHAISLYVVLQNAGLWTLVTPGFL